MRAWVSGEQTPRGLYDADKPAECIAYGCWGAQVCRAPPRPRYSGYGRRDTRIFEECCQRAHHAATCCGRNSKPLRSNWKESTDGVDAETGEAVTGENWIACLCWHEELAAIYRGHGAADARGWSDRRCRNLPCAAKLPNQCGTVSTGCVRGSGKYVPISLH